MPVKIRYKFKDDKKSYTCIVTYEQFQNFKELPIVKECEVITEAEQNYEQIKNKMQKALDKVAKNDTSSIRKLSEISPA